MNRGRAVLVRSTSGGAVLLTRERCEALRLDGSRCTTFDLRGEGPRVLCWLHRVTEEHRPLSFAEEVTP